MALRERRSATALERSEPLLEFEHAADRLRRLLEDTFGDTRPAGAEPSAWMPVADVEETDDAYVVEAELPGVEREDVNIELVGNELMISGEIKERERAGILRRRTRRTGRFEYRVALPVPVDTEHIEARLEDGVLTVRVPKSERARRRRIEIKS